MQIYSSKKIVFHLYEHTCETKSTRWRGKWFNISLTFGYLSSLLVLRPSHSSTYRRRNISKWSEEFQYTTISSVCLISERSNDVSACDKSVDVGHIYMSKATTISVTVHSEYHFATRCRHLEIAAYENSTRGYCSRAWSVSHCRTMR